MKRNILLVTSIFFFLICHSAVKGVPQKKTEAKPTPQKEMAAKPTPPQVYNKLEIRVLAVEKVEEFKEFPSDQHGVKPREGFKMVIVRLGIKPQEQTDKISIKEFELIETDGKKHKSPMDSKTLLGSGGPPEIITAIPFTIPEDAQFKFKTFKIEEVSFDVEKLASKITK